MKILNLLLFALPFTAVAEPNLCLNPPVVLEHPFFYRIQRGQEQGHILGTMHVGIPLKAMPPKVRDEVEHATVGVGEAFESNIFRLEWTSWRMLGLFSGLNKPMLSKQLNSTDYAILKSRLKKIGYHSYFGPLSPAGAIYVLNFLGPESKHGQLDFEISESFSLRGTRQLGLESLSAQLEAMKRTFTITELREELHADGGHDEYCRIFWTGNEKAMREKIEEIDPHDPINQSLIFARNQAWIPRIEQILSTSARPFFYVGGTHLFGEQGVLHLLEQRGFTVERVD